MARNRSLVTVCAAAIVLLLVADVAAAVVVTGRNQIHTPRQLKGVLPTLVAFVEKNRGLEFTQGVDIFLLDDQEFDEAVAGAGPSTADPAAVYLESRSLVGFL